MAGGIALVVVAAGLVGGRALGIWGDDGPVATPGPSPMPAEPVDPFAGTPAEDFAEGADGIVLPEAEPIGDFTADEVAEALELVRDALIAARLDPAMLVKHDGDVLLDRLAPGQRQTVVAAFESGDFGRFATQIADNAVLAPAEPRVHGRLSYEITTAGAFDTPILQVVSRFVWVYAFEPVEDGLSPHLVVVRDELTWEVTVGHPWPKAAEGAWLPVADSHVWGADCAVYDDGIVRPAGESAALLGDQAGIFDPDQPLDTSDTC